MLVAFRAMALRVSIQLQPHYAFKQLRRYNVTVTLCRLNFLTIFFLQVVRSASAIFPATASSPATSVLLGALGNSVYFQFDPDIPFEKQVSFAHVVVQQQERIAKLEQQVAAQARELEASKVQVDDKLRSVTEVSYLPVKEKKPLS